MANKLVKEKKSKKEIRSEVYHKLAAALSGYKKEIKPKAFEEKLKEASKLFAGIIKVSEKKAGKPKKKTGKVKVTEKKESQSAES
jgi:hypothetical protein